MLHKYPWGLHLIQKCYRKSPPRRKKMIAGYFKGGTIVISENLDRTHPLSPPHSITTHAECAVLRGIEDGTNGKIFIYRELKNGSPALAKPCPSCERLIKSKGIKTIIFSTPDGFIKEKILDK